LLNYIKEIILHFLKKMIHIVYPNLALYLCSMIDYWSPGIHILSLPLFPHLLVHVLTGFFPLFDIALID